MIAVDTASAVLERFESLCHKRVAEDPTFNEKRLRQAFAQAQAMYGDEEHWTGETILEHCFGVVEQYMRFAPDDDGMVAGLLHHALDAKRLTLDEVERAYGPVVRSLISGVHLLSHVTMQNRRMSLQNLRLMFVRVAEDVRVVLLILCDHYHILSLLPRLTQEQRRHVSRDALQIFAPVAARLGIYSFKHALESFAFPVVYPTDAARIAEQLQEMHTRLGSFLERAATDLMTALQERGVTSYVEAREKQPFSIFRKMRSKSITHVGDLYDLFALRVIVENEAACYQTLGVLHQMGHPVANRFKDFIAFPKPNGYQSLHTTLARLPMVPEGVVMEVQIRTAAMHREAKLGIAAHWSYKEGGGTAHAMRRERVQRALTMQQPSEDQERVMSDHIFVLTPQGQIVELPEGAVPLDFAFHVHTMLGLSFRGARVNGSIVPIAYELENGDIVEILRYSEPRPSPQWVTHLKTASARTRLKHFLDSHERPLHVQAGKESLNHELLKHGLPGLDPNLTLLRHVDGKRMTLSEREEILMKIGLGSQNCAELLSHLDGIRAKLPRRKDEKEVMPLVSSQQVYHVHMDGDIPMPMRFARCCKADEGMPVPIQGVVGRDGIVRVHKKICKMLRNVNPERALAVRWEDDGRRTKD